MRGSNMKYVTVVWFDEGSGLEPHYYYSPSLLTARNEAHNWAYQGVGTSNIKIYNCADYQNALGIGSLRPKNRYEREVHNQLKMWDAELRVG